MSKTGPIILVEDDVNDVDVVKAAITDNGITNPILCFYGAKQALDQVGIVLKPTLVVRSSTRSLQNKLA